MIDWLEVLWKAAEEGAEFRLPGEHELLPLKSGETSGPEEDRSLTATEFFAKALEPESAVRLNSRGDLTASETLELPESAEVPRIAETNRMGTYLRSILRPGRFPVAGDAVRKNDRSGADSALTALYHRVRETVSPTLSGLPGRSNAVVVREEISASSGLTEEGLDRSLRRDSRRYDGGISIY